MNRFSREENILIPVNFLKSYSWQKGSTRERYDLLKNISCMGLIKIPRKKWRSNLVFIEWVRIGGVWVNLARTDFGI